jgi:hypothetical protein
MIAANTTSKNAKGETTVAAAYFIDKNMQKCPVAAKTPIMTPSRKLWLSNRINSNPGRNGTNTMPTTPLYSDEINGVASADMYFVKNMYMPMNTPPARPNNPGTRWIAPEVFRIRFTPINAVRMKSIWILLTDSFSNTADSITEIMGNMYKSAMASANGMDAILIKKALVDNARNNPRNSCIRWFPTTFLFFEMKVWEPVSNTRLTV